ncbi:DUF2849 domain-containing protein [Nereida sp. MMG025]|uniref:DUF2849 domain-containing protein n=1 Tax=Nereida sp. MMG025 TaxID=2909981 RepID=UPI001F43D8D7|nr:DUF2849 domain-containing protein [Nereida sp. MMG025]MCF6445366.1 DUF2849 domain-containing protein [Nereida sp. MMG025]
MSRPFTKVITANALLEGDVIYWTEEATWTRHLSKAEVFEDEAIADEQLMTASAQTDIAVGVYLADVHLENGLPQPTHFRETFRTKGPSNYAHGKQVELN